MAVIIALMIAIITIFMGSATSQKDCVILKKHNQLLPRPRLLVTGLKSGTSANTNAKAVFNYWTQRRGSLGLRQLGLSETLPGRRSSFTLDQRNCGDGGDFISLRPF